MATENKKNSEEPEQKIDKKIEERENRQVAWFIGIVVLIFVIAVGTYFYVQGMNKFNYDGVPWAIENEGGGLIIYHARFPAFYNPNITYNLYLRNDPRTNDVPTQGNFSDFRYDSLLAFSPQVDACRGDIPRVVVDLAMFLKSDIGVKKLDPATTNLEISKEANRTYADCSIVNQGVFIIQMGNKSSVIQNEKNSFCYTITIQNCTDIAPVEKFIIETVKNMYGNKSSQI